MLNIQMLIDDAKCYEVVRALRWPAGVRCPHCVSERVSKRGFHNRQAHRQCYRCQACGRQFDDLNRHNLSRTSSALAGVGLVFVFHGAEPFQSTDCPGIGVE